MMEKTEKIYVAGHRGMAGSAIFRKLEAEGHERIVIRTRAELDLTRQADVEYFFDQERPAYVFLAAAKVGGIWSNNIYPAQFIRDNLAIQLNIIDCAHRFGAKKLLFLGSSCIYPKHCPQPMKEEYLLTGPLEPTNEPYAVAKIAGIKMCQSYRREHGSNFISVMPTNLYGQNDNYDLVNAHVLAALIRKFHLAKLAAGGDHGAIEKDEEVYGPIPEDVKRALGLIDPDRAGAPEVLLWGTGTPKREFLNADDLADACVFLMNNYDAPEIVNIGAGTDLTIRELADMIAEIVGFTGKVTWDASMPDGTPKKLLDVSKLSDLGWRRKIGLEEGIRGAYAWYLSNIESG